MGAFLDTFYYWRFLVRLVFGPLICLAGQDYFSFLFDCGYRCPSIHLGTRDYALDSQIQDGMYLNDPDAVIARSGNL